jgi:hypothetical protein
MTSRSICIGRAILPLAVLVSALLLAASCGEEDAPPAPLFHLVTGGDLPSLGATYGGTLLDIDADGWLDVLMADPALETALFLNDGTLGFTKSAVGAYAGLAGSEYHGAAPADFDNDGDWDVFITAATDDGHRFGRNHLWVQEAPGAFQDLGYGDEVISDPIGRGQAGLWTDFDGDRLPELLVFNFQSPPLLAAPSAAGWQDVSDRLPWPPPVPMRRDGSPPEPRVRSRSGWVHTGIAADFDGDGHQDLLAIGRPGWSGLLMNPGSGAFAERTTVSGLKHALWPRTPRQAALGDINGDGLPDLAFCYRTADDFTRIYAPLEFWLNQSGPGQPAFTMERFVEQDDGEASLLQAVRKPETCQLADLDNDGHLDLYVVQPGREAGEEPNQLYQGHGDGTFREVSEAWGGGGPPDSAPESAWAVDLDNDGDLDLLTFNGGEPYLETAIHRGVALYENAGAVGLVAATEDDAQTAPPADMMRGVTLQLVSRTGPPHGLGAVATLNSGERQQVRWQHCRVSGNNSAILPLHFGVGTAEGPFRLDVRWSQGTTQTYVIPEAGRAYIVPEGEGTVQQLPRREKGARS